MKPTHSVALPALSLVAALACSSGLAGCRQVTEISFHSNVDPAPTISRLVVNLHDVKKSMSLDNLNDKIGLYDLAGPNITITVWGCSGDQIVLTNPDPRSYPVGDKVVVPLSPYHGDSTVQCPRVLDGGVIGEPGGEGGMTGAGGMGGEGGMTGAGGMGGETIGAGGNPDAGVGGAGGDDSGVGAGGCDGGGAGGATDAGTCEPPSGPPEAPVVSTLNPACAGYCSDMATTCGGLNAVYTSVPQCQRYCTLAGWAAGGNNLDRDDTIACREAYEVMAAGVPETERPAKCAIAGPSGDFCVSVSQCVRFCNAFSGVCGGNKQACQNACATLPAAAVNCRFPWLLSASDDTRYCRLIDLTTVATSCQPPGC